MSLILKCLSLAIIYFFLTGLFKKPSFSLERNFKTIPNEDPYKKLIYIVLDALRYDYTIENSKNNSEYKIDNPFFHNKLKNFYKILKENNSFHSLSVCGIPTSTTCRITGLLTGSPSNFLEGTKTFLNSKILIDNLIEQINKKMKVSFYGDGTWLSLFPYLSKNSKTFDPYTKLNLIEEEKRVMDEMIKSMGEKCDEDKGDGKKWDEEDKGKDKGVDNDPYKTATISNDGPSNDHSNNKSATNFNNNNNLSIFCHLISLDSFGHAFGLNHKIIEETLVRFDNFIKEVYDKMDDSTLLVITSDHGVTDEGAHGGVTKEEMSSFVSFISKKNLKINKIPNEIIKLRNKFISKCYKVDNEDLIVHQDDILPTICYLMNLPIPSNSYGNFIHELVGDEEAYKVFLEMKMVGCSSKSRCEGDGKFGFEEDGSKSIFEEDGSKSGVYKDLKSGVKENGSPLGPNPFNNDIPPTNILPLIFSHYEFSQKIYENVSGKDNFKLLICFGLGVLVIIIIFKRLLPFISKKSLTFLFLIFNLSFSVQSVINEDLYWLGCFLLFNPTKINFFCSIFYLIIDTKFGIYNELITRIKRKFHFESYKKDGDKLILMIILYLIVSCYRKKRGSSKDCSKVKDMDDSRDSKIKDNSKVKNKDKNMDKNVDDKDTVEDTVKDVKTYPSTPHPSTHPSTYPSTSHPSTSTNNPTFLCLLILFKYFFPSFFTPIFNLSLFSSFLSMDILCLIVFRPLESFFILIISNHLQFSYDLISFYILLNLSVGYSGLIKQIQSINYEIFYIFSSNPKWYEVIIPILVYFVYPRYLIMSRFNLKLIDNFLIFDILNLLITLSSTYYFFDSMNFYFHFASRCFFVCLYFVIDMVLVK